VGAGANGKVKRRLAQSRSPLINLGFLARVCGRGDHRVCVVSVHSPSLHCGEEKEREKP